MPSHTPQDHGRVGQTGQPDIVGPLTRLLLSARDVLPHAANGQTKAPSSPYVANVRREMGQGRSQEFKRLRAVAMCDLADGVPFPLVIAPFRQLITELEMEAVRLHRIRPVERPLSALVRAETRAQQRLDLAELKLVESPTSVAAIQDVIRDADLYRANLDALTTGCEATLSVVRNQERRVIGAKPLNVDVRIMRCTP